MIASLYTVLKLKTYKLDSTDTPESVSIIIAARNEEIHIRRCLESILEQDFPLSRLEVIVVNDHSEDGTAKIVNDYASRGIHYLQLIDEDGFGKKAALNKGIAAAKHSIIVTTDADCLFHKSWVSTLVSFRKKTNSKMVVAPVTLIAGDSMLNIFQSLDFLSLQGMTMAGVSTGKLNMCNGANLLYDKAAFDTVNGFKGIDHIASGDDMLLMEKISEAFPGKINYCLSKEAIVETESAISLKAFFQQRIRWASKAIVYKSIYIKATLLLVYMLNFGLMSCLIMAIVNRYFFITYLLLTLSKTIIELPFMLKVSSFFDKKKICIWFLPMQPLHQIYIVLSGLFGLIGLVEWKGRRV